MTRTNSAERRPIFKYENALLILLGLSFGFAFFDRNAASVLIPYMAKGLSLTNTRSALINSVLSAMWALGAYVIARWSDSMGRRKPFLPVCLAIMAVESSPNRRGVNAGIMQNFFAALLGQSLAPWLLPIIAE